MKFCVWSGVSLLVLGVALSVASANAGPPRRFNQPALVAGPKEAELVVVVDPKAKQPRLEVPRNLLVAPPAGRRLGDAGGTPDVVAGLALALAFTSGGLWLSKRGRTFAIALGAVSLFTFGGAVYADLIRPRAPKEAKEQVIPLPAGVKLSEKITLQIVDRGDSVRLIVGASSLIHQPKLKIVPSERPR